MIRVSPSILAADFADLGRDIGRIKQAGAEYRGRYTDHENASNT